MRVWATFTFLLYAAALISYSATVACDNYDVIKQAGGVGGVGVGGGGEQ